MRQDRDLPWDRRPLTARDFVFTVAAGVVLLAVSLGLLLSRSQPPQESQTPPQLAGQAQAPTAIPNTITSAQAGEGEALFDSKCKACHTIGGGHLVGPDLQGVTEIRDVEWLTRWISAPDKMLAEKDPTAVKLLAENGNIPMPNLGLSPEQVASLIAYLGNPQSAGAEVAQPAPPQALEGNPTSGRALFLGEARFENGGPACMACHSVAGIGALGGGALGPDLTQVLSRYGGAQGLDAFLGGVPTPTMNAVWSDHPLSEQERLDLIAFLQGAPVQQRAPQALLLIAALAAGGAAVLIGAAGLIWRRRLRQVRQPLLRRPA